MDEYSYRGRFAPSPSGPLHFGSLITAVGSHLEARVHKGEWLVRIEDIDEPRCDRKHEISILRTLEYFGFQIDGDIIRQSERKEQYQKALNRLFHESSIFGCACTRKEISDSQTGIDGAHIYPGTCRAGTPDGREARAWRIRVFDHVVSFNDAVQGRITQHLAMDVGDFVLLRADGFFAYQLAVVVDDAEQGITHVVRGADLLDSTPRQIFLQQCLGFPTPHYAHLPLALNEAGEKLSKQTLAQQVDDLHPVDGLWRALDFLGQQPPPELRKASLSEIWEWAIINWSLAKVPKVRTATPPTQEVES